MTFSPPVPPFTAWTTVLLVGILLLGVGSPPDAPTNPQTPSRAVVDSVVTIKATGSKLEYETTELELVAGTIVTIRLDNSESTMPHNIVLLTGRDHIRTVGIAALQAQQTDYIPDSEADKILAHTPLAKPGSVVEVTFEVPPPGEYPYICTYPGHFQTMRGTLTSVEGT